MKTCGIHLMIAALSITGLSARDKQPPTDRRPPPPLLLPILDADKNGELSDAEIQAAPAALLKLDKNNDGELTPREIAPPPPKGKKSSKKSSAGKRPAPKGSPVIVITLDLDNNRVLSSDEIDEAYLTLLDLDEDGDGTISRDELKHAKPPVKHPA